MSGCVCVAVCVHGWHPQAHGGVCSPHHGGDRPQAALWDHLAGHQPVLLQVLHVQGWARAVRQRKYSKQIFIFI